MNLWKFQTKGSWKARLFYGLGFVLLAVIYSVVLVTATSWWWRRERLHGAAVVDTPLRSFMNYEPTKMIIGHEAKDYELMGYPSEELDTAWADLMQDFYTEVPYSYVENVRRLDEGIPSEGGGFLAIYSFMHQLHCLKRIHHSYWPERYYPNTTEKDRVNLQEHNLHCLQMLMKAIMCHADTNPETLHWVDENQFPLGNRDSPHECVNWDLLMDGMKQSRVDPFKPGVLVHPKYGPVVPNGKNTIIAESEKHRFIINETIIHNEDKNRKGR